MTEETAMALIEALNRFSGVLERLQGGAGTLGGGIHIYHHGIQPQYYQPAFHPHPGYSPYTVSNIGGLNQ